MGFWCEARIAVSSAYVAVIVCSVSGKFAVYMDPRILPCGTPDWMVWSVVYTS